MQIIVKCPTCGKWNRPVHVVDARPVAIHYWYRCKICGDEFIVEDNCTKNEYRLLTVDRPRITLSELLGSTEPIEGDYRDWVMYSHAMAIDHYSNDEYTVPMRDRRN